jgi:hypothetical protein
MQACLGRRRFRSRLGFEHPASTFPDCLSDTSPASGSLARPFFPIPALTSLCSLGNVRAGCWQGTSEQRWEAEKAARGHQSLRNSDKPHAWGSTHISSHNPFLQLSRQAASASWHCGTCKKCASMSLDAAARTPRPCCWCVCSERWVLAISNLMG